MGLGGAEPDLGGLEPHLGSVGRDQCVQGRIQAAQDGIWEHQVGSRGVRPDLGNARIPLGTDCWPHATHLAHGAERLSTTARLSV